MSYNRGRMEGGDRQVETGTVRKDVRMSAETLAEIERLATREHRTLSDMIRELLRRGLEQTQRRKQAAS